MAEWIAHWICNFGTQRGELVVRGSSPGWGAKHFSILSVLSSATFPGQILNFNENFTLYSSQTYTWVGRGVCVGNGVNVAKLSTDKIEKCLAPQPGLEPRTTRFPLCDPKLQSQCANHAATEPKIFCKEYWLKTWVQNCKCFNYHN